MATLRRAVAPFLLACACVLLLDALVCMVTGPTPLRLGALALPARRLQAELAIAAGLGALVAWRHLARSGRGSLALVLGLACFAALMANTRLIASADTTPTATVPFMVLREGTLALDRASWISERDERGGAYYLQQSGGRTVSMYPVATGLLALPFYLPAALGRFDPASDAASDLQKLAAAALTALGVAFLFSAMRRWVSLRAAVGAVTVYVVGTAVSPILGQALWQHTGAALAFSIGLWALVSGRAVIVGLAAGVAVACRAPDLVLAAALVFALARESRRSALHAALAAVIPLGLVAAYNTWAFGAPWSTGYGAHASGGWGLGWQGTLGTLVSPGRGLFVVSPVLLFAVVPLVRRAPVLAGGVAAFWLMMSQWQWWDGAFSAGPRMLSDTLPFLGMGLALALEQVRRRWLLGAAIACSVAVNALLTYAYPPAATKEWVWTLSESAWSPRAYPPAAFVLGWTRSTDLSAGPAR